MSTETCRAALKRLSNWRSLFAGWQLGTRASNDPECQAVRDHRDLSMMLRVEQSAIVGLLLAKGVFTEEEWADAVEREANLLHGDYLRRFPGIKATDYGLEISLPEAAETMKGWKP